MNDFSKEQKSKDNQNFLSDFIRHLRCTQDTGLL